MSQNDFIRSIQSILERDLQKLENEIKAYPDDKSVWLIRGKIKNSAGTLVLHLCGNLQHYIGKQLGASSYIRNRDLEFSERNTPRNQLILEINKTKESVSTALDNLQDAILDMDYPEQVFGHAMSTRYFLIHLVGHFNYHLGQINYHRRLLVAL
jgi:uncharacterized damage-inducible protein DinB